LHPGRFQAVVMHSGVPPGTAHSTMSALGAMRGQRATKPLAAPMAAPLGLWPPLLVIHGQADLVVAPRNGKACAQVWADALGAEPEPARSVQRGQRYAMSVTDFKRQGRTVVSLAEVDGLAHAWSGGAPKHPFSDPQGPDASRMVWAFAARQFRAGGI
jgi:poly(3-hydroxybutyrate) depolymerase